jgi:hypothetical protein
MNRNLNMYVHEFDFCPQIYVYKMEIIVYTGVGRGRGQKGFGDYNLKVLN